MRGLLRKLDPVFCVRVALAVVAIGCGSYVIDKRIPNEVHEAVWDQVSAYKRSVAEGNPLPKPKPPKVDPSMTFGFWYGCLFTGIAAGLLLGTSRWWLNTKPVSKIELSQQGCGQLGRRRFMFLLGGIVILSAIPRLPRMNDSLWGDEDWAYRDLIGGVYTPKEPRDLKGVLSEIREHDGSLNFERHSWKVTAFNDKGTNNQYAYTLTARRLHDWWKDLTDAPPEAFNESVLRLPSLLAGLGSIAMGALLLRRLGFSNAGLVFAVLMAIHPWHLRYSSEARGYTMLIFFLLAGIYFLLAALEDGRWRWWCAFALFEFLALYTWKAAIHPVAALNLAIFGILLASRRREINQFARWLVVNIGVLMLFVPLFAPAIPQIRRKLAVSTQAKGKMELPWFKDVLAQLVGGADWIAWGGWALLVAAVAVGLLGYGLGWMRRSPGWLLLVAPIAGAVIAFIHFSLSNDQLLKWYVFYTLPFLAMLVAVGLARLGWWKYPLIVAYAAAISYVFIERVTAPIQQSREAAEVTRNADEGMLHMGPTDIVTVGLFRASQSYDPRMRQGRDLRSGEALMAVVAECRASGKALRVSAANLGFARSEHPDFFTVLENTEIFRKTGDLPAAEAYLDIETYEMVE